MDKNIKYNIYWLNNDNKFELIYKQQTKKQIIDYANLKIKEYVNYKNGKVLNKLNNIDKAINYLEKFEDIKIKICN